MLKVSSQASNNNPIKGTPLNPHNPSMYTGGAAGGAGYALATGLVPIAIGVDDGGSIRVPAGFCGAYSLKPTHGRVLEHHGTVLAPSLAVYGPMASSIDDLHLSFKVMTGSFSAEGSEPYIPNMLSSVCTRPEKPKLLGICSPWVERADPSVRLAFKRTIEHYTRNCGYRVVEISLPQLPLGQTAHALTLLSEVRSFLTHEARRGLTPPSRLVLGVSAPASADDYIAAQRLRNMLMQHLSWLWHQHPQMVILTPVSPLEAWRVSNPSKDLGKRGVSDSDTGLRCMEYTWLANFTGVPAVTRPVTYATETGIPISVMAMGEWGSEEYLLDWAKEGEDILNDIGGLRRPPTWVDAIQLGFNVMPN
jgi:Asp-tRNA(Asn)/Glu-tRNA(Gln) amidotransferase A subunit family amidase